MGTSLTSRERTALATLLEAIPGDELITKTNVNRVGSLNIGPVQFFSYLRRFANLGVLRACPELCTDRYHDPLPFVWARGGRQLARELLTSPVDRSGVAAQKSELITLDVLEALVNTLSESDTVTVVVLHEATGNARETIVGRLHGLQRDGIVTIHGRHAIWTRDGRRMARERLARAGRLTK